MENKFKNLTEEQRKKILAAAELVDKGDMAVMKKIIEFQDSIDGNTQKIDGIEKKVDDTIVEARTTVELLKAETATKLAEVKDNKILTKEELLSLIKPLIPVVPKVKDGKTPTKKELQALIEPLIPIVLDGKNPNPEDVVPFVLKKIPPVILDDRQKIVEKINTGQEKDIKIDTNQIVGFQKAKKDLDFALGVLDKRTEFLINKTSVKSVSGGSGISVDNSNPSNPIISSTGAGSGDMTKAVYDPANIAEQLIGLVATQTLTNKRITPRVVTVADATSITPNSDTSDIVYQLNTQVAGTLTINSDSGTPTNGQRVWLKIKTTNAQTYSWNAQYVSGSGTGSLTLPTTTSGSGKIDNLGFVYDSVNSKYQFIAYAPGY